MKTARRKFTEEEDQQLRMLVEEHGAHKWDYIAASMPGRTGRQCRDRYQNYLCPGISRDEWTREEEQLLLEKYEEYGSQWSKISKFFQGRTGTALKNRWNYYVSRHSRSPSSPSDETSSDEQMAIRDYVSSSDKGSPIEQIFDALTAEDHMEIAMLEISPLFDCVKDSNSLFFI